MLPGRHLVMSIEPVSPSRDTNQHYTSLIAIVNSTTTKTSECDDQAETREQHEVEAGYHNRLRG